MSNHDAAAGILAGIKVVDLSGITAGARTTQQLGDFGADVIKVESKSRFDPFRVWRAVTGTVGTGDLASHPFRVANRNKRDVTIDLKTEEGLQAFRRLVEWGDLVVENFARGVMERLRISFDQLRAWNPAIVLLSISSQGNDGPDARYVSFGGTLEALGGLMSVTGYDALSPTWSTNKLNYPDQLVSALAPGLAVHAVREARQTGRGQWVDLAQRESVIALLGPDIAADAATGRQSGPSGDRGPAGDGLCCRCAGEDQWLAVSVPDDATWTRACAVIGAEPGVRPSPDEMEAAVGAWSQTLDKVTAMRLLQAGGVPAAALLSSPEITHEAAGLGESLLVDVPTADGGAERQMRWPFDIEPGGRPSIRMRAPHLGEHTAEVLAQLGLTEAEIDQVDQAAAPEREPGTTTESGKVKAS
jgi:crotonobetainyl-CoA:carnitine CoA-transferase CaiB-like acyl-CoA transferase